MNSKPIINTNYIYMDTPQNNRRIAIQLAMLRLEPGVLERLLNRLFPDFTEDPYPGIDLTMFVPSWELEAVAKLSNPRDHFRFGCTDIDGGTTEVPMAPNAASIIAKGGTNVVIGRQEWRKLASEEEYRIANKLQAALSKGLGVTVCATEINAKAVRMNLVASLRHLLKPRGELLDCSGKDIRVVFQPTHRIGRLPKIEACKREIRDLLDALGEIYIEADVEPPQILFSVPSYEKGDESLDVWFERLRGLLALEADDDQEFPLLGLMLDLSEQNINTNLEAYITFLKSLNPMPTCK